MDYVTVVARLMKGSDSPRVVVGDAKLGRSPRLVTLICQEALGPEIELDAVALRAMFDRLNSSQPRPAVSMKVRGGRFSNVLSATADAARSSPP